MSNATSQEALLRAIAHASSALVFAFDLTGRCLLANEKLVTLLGKAASDILGHSREDFLPPEVARLNHANDLAVARSGCEQVIEEENEEPDGRHVYQSKKFPIRNEAGEVVAIGGISYDITALKQAEAALFKSQSLFENIAQTAPVGIFSTDGNGKCIYVNSRWCEIAGISSEAAMGSGWAAALHPEDQATVYKEWNDAVLEKRAFNLEYRFQHASGLVIWVVGQGIAEFDEASRLIGFVGTISDITEIRKKTDDIELARKQLEKLALENLNIQERERQTMSQELHDDIGQTLTALKFAIKSATRHCPPEARRAMNFLQEANKISDALLQRVRDIARQLRPMQIDNIGLAAALRAFLEEARGQGELDVQFAENIGYRRFSPEVELAAFRIVQESISNAFRHSNAASVRVNATLSDSELVLRIQDDGCGFNVDETLAADISNIPLGIIGMRERATGVGGTVRIDSKIGEGTEVCAKFRMVFDK